MLAPGPRLGPCPLLQVRAAVGDRRLLVGGAVRDARDVVLEDGRIQPRRLERRGPAELRADVDIRRAELVPEDVGALGEHRLERANRVLVASVAEGTLALDGRALEHGVEERGLETARSEEEPAVIGAPALVTRRRRQ